MRRARAVWLALCLTALPSTQSLAGPTWNRGAGSYVETTGALPEGPGKDRPTWPLRARFSQPTDRYDHDILGGIPHWSMLTVEAQSCGLCRSGSEVYQFVLPDSMVFEDIAPRLWDVTGDGRPEVVVIETSLDRGGRLAVWGIAEPQGDFTRLAVTAFIGAPHRWLAPVGVGDFDGDGRIEMAFVDRPHLAKELVLVRLEGGRLSEIARSGGFSPHRIGDTTITSAVRTCADGQAEILLPDAGWSRLMAVQLVAGRLLARDLGSVSANALRAAATHPCD